MLIDSDPSTRYIARLAMEEAGYLVIEFTRGESALEAFSHTQQDLILINAELNAADTSALNGFQTCRAIRAMQGEDDERRIPILMLTPSDDSTSIDAAYAAGATDYLSYPISMNLLRRQLKQLLRAKYQEEEVHYLAYYDCLTGLPNRALMNEHLDYTLEECARNRTTFALMVIDIDNLKLINDSLGHFVGDAYLCKVAQRLNEYLRMSDLVARSVATQLQSVARFGGDEFIVLLKNPLSPNEITFLAKRILIALNKPIYLDGAELPLSVSIGIVFYPTDATHSQGLIENATVAMREAKLLGRNTFCFYDMTMNDFANDRLRLENEMNNALTNEQFVLHYRPMVSFESACLSGVQAIIRLANPHGQHRDDNDMVSVAEASNMIHALGEWMLQKACLDCLSWINEGLKHCGVSVQLTEKQWENRQLIKVISRILSQTKLAPEYLSLVISESVLMQDPAYSLATLTKLHDRGVKLIISDVGEGDKSLPLRYLTQFPLDAIKTKKDTNTLGVVSALARELDLVLIIDGIESGEEYAFLKGKYGDYAQGAYFGDTISAEKLMTVNPNNPII